MKPWSTYKAIGSIRCLQLVERFLQHKTANLRTSITVIKPGSLQMQGYVRHMQTVHVFCWYVLLPQHIVVSWFSAVIFRRKASKALKPIISNVLSNFTIPIPANVTMGKRSTIEQDSYVLWDCHAAWLRSGWLTDPSPWKNTPVSGWYMQICRMHTREQARVSLVLCQTTQFTAGNATLAWNNLRSRDGQGRWSLLLKTQH